MDSLLMSTIDTMFRMERESECSWDCNVETKASLASRDGYLQCEDTQWHDTSNYQWHTVTTQYYSRVCLVIEALDDVVWRALREG